MVEKASKQFRGEVCIKELTDSELIVEGSLCEIDGERFGIGFEVGDKVRSVFLALRPVYGDWVMVNMEFDGKGSGEFLGAEFVVGGFKHSEKITIIDDGFFPDGNSLRDIKVSGDFFREANLLDVSQDCFLDMSGHVKGFIEVVHSKILGANTVISNPLAAMKFFVEIGDLKPLLKSGRGVSGKKYDWRHFLSNYTSYDSALAGEALGAAYKSKEVGEGYMLEYFLKGCIGSVKMKPYRENLLNEMSDDCVRRMFGFVKKDAKYDGGVLKVWVDSGYKYLSFEDKSKNFISVEDMEGGDVSQVDIYRTFLKRLV